MMRGAYVGKRRFAASSCLACLLLAGASLQGALPKAPAPLARGGVVRQPAKMVVTPLFDRDGTSYKRVEFRAGTRSLVVNGYIGIWPWNHLAHFGLVSLLEGTTCKAELHLHLMDEWDGKTIAPGEKLEIDETRGAATWRRPYVAKDGSTNVFTYVLHALDDGKVALDYDFGLSLDAARKIGKLPVFCRLTLDEMEDGAVEYGFGGTVHEMYPAAAMLAKNSRQENVGFGSIESPLFTYEMHDETKRWSLAFPRASLMSAYGWLEYPGTMKGGKRMRSSMIYAGNAFGDFTRANLQNDVKGRFVWDLGASSTPATPGEKAVGGIDFWALDALHVPAPASRNWMMNGSFEQDFKGWRWEDWGARYAPGKLPREEIVTNGLFGGHALCLRATQWGCPEICSAPMPLVNGRTYVVSCWAKPVSGVKGDFVFRMRSVSNKGKYFQFRGLKDFPNPVCTKPEWTRFSHVFTADHGGFYVQLAPGYGAGEAGVLIDGVQVEEAPAATPYVEAPATANLLSANPFNDFKPGEKMDAQLALQSLAGAKGVLRVRVKDAYRETCYDRTFPFDLAAGAAARVPLALDTQAWRKGLYVMRFDFDAAGAKWTDYTRFSIQAPLANKHPTAQFYANHAWYNRVSRAPHYVRKFVEWGWGCVDGRRNDAAAGDLSRQWGIRNYVHPVAYEGGEVQAAVTNRPGGSRAPFPGFNNLTGKPEELELFEVAAYQSAKKADPQDDIWTFYNEEESWSREKGYETHWKFVEAVQRGVRRAFAERGLPPPRFCETHGTSHYFNGRNYDAIEGYLRTALAHGFRYDVVTIHPYSNVDGGVLGSHDADVETKHLIDTMASFGYPASTPIMFTECFNMQPWVFPTWGCDGWGDSYRSNTTPSHDMGNREFLMAATQMRLYLLALKYWPKVQLVHPWNREPIVDVRFTPLLFTFAANTLGHLLPDPVFVGDAQPYGDVRGYCFRRLDGRFLMAVWTTNHDVENGVKRSPVLEMSLPGDVRFLDMFGNERTPDGAKSEGRTATIRVPLTPAPLFLVSQDAAALLKGLREAVADDPSTALRADLRPDAAGTLNLALENLTTAARTGVVEAGSARIAYDLPPRGKRAYPVASGSTAPMALNKWKGRLTPVFDKPWRTAWFFVPKCGEKPDWDKIPALPLETVQGVARGTSASCQYAWNAEGLFLRVTVKDADYLPRTGVFKPRDLYVYDGCVEVYFDAFADARSQGEKNYDGNDSRYDFHERDVHRLKAVNWQLAQGTQSATDDEIKEKLTRTWTRTADGYVYDFHFAKRYLAPIDLKPGTVAGAAVCVHAYNRGKDGKKIEHASISNATRPGEDCNCKPYLFPLMILGE